MKMTLFDSSYQVMHLTGGQLLINSPPDYGFALPFFVIGLGSAVFFLVSCIPRANTLATARHIDLVWAHLHLHDDGSSVRQCHAGSR
jgi:hypothetical protein